MRAARFLSNIGPGAAAGTEEVVVSSSIAVCTVVVICKFEHAHGCEVRQEADVLVALARAAGHAADDDEAVSLCVAQSVSVGQARRRFGVGHYGEAVEHV